MKVTPLELEGLYLLEPIVHGDHRGYFMETYNEAILQRLGLQVRFVQDNHSLSKEKGVIRGLHYQLPPKAQTKLVRVLAGAIYDVVVDLRRQSPTFGKWIGIILSEENKRQLFVPKGFAHGFCTLTPNTQVFYKVDEFYAPEYDRGIRWDDPSLQIDWPVSDPVLSDKDRSHPDFKYAELGF
ncbi:dTDP-4-dehydrorhamnose 3,5-epimerase [Paenibacillus sp. MB22_1]|uniref:dTDP-4-dehydrorhamnose 3,5-epimerase n=1 Tax=Paenibacillus sp. MB22_1 TaxID=3383121 RepID=UPI0039A36945